MRIAALARLSIKQKIDKIVAGNKRLILLIN